MIMNKMIDDRFGRQRDIQHFFLPAPIWVDQIAISAGTNTEYTIPTGAIFMVISAPQFDFWVKTDGAAVAAVAGVTDGSGSFLNPGQYNVRDVTTLGFISASNLTVTVCLYV